MKADHDKEDVKLAENAFDIFECPICDFNSTWENGLSVHMGRKHNSIEQLDGQVDIAEIREAAHAANETMVQCEVIYFTRRYNIYWQPRGLAAGGWLCSCEGRSNSSHGILRTLRNLSSLSPSPPRPPARPPALRDGGTLTSPGMAAHSRPQGWRYTHVLRDGGTLASTGMAAH